MDLVRLRRSGRVVVRGAGACDGAGNMLRRDHNAGPAEPQVREGRDQHAL